MEQPSIETLLSIQNVWTALLCFFVFVALFNYFRRPKNIPPGPRGWPFIGNLPTFVFSSWRKEHVHDLMTRLARKYGKVFCLEISGTSRVIVINDISLIREAFQKPELSDRPPSAIINQVTKGRGVAICSGDIWKHQRRFSLTVFRSFGVGKTSFDDKIATEASCLVNEISREFSDKPFDPRKLLMNATANMICSILLGKRFEYTDVEFQHLLELFDERVKRVGGGALQAQVPILRMLNRKNTDNLLKILRKIVDYFTKVVMEHKILLQKSGECNDLMDLYLKEIEQYRDDQEMLQTVNEDHLVMFVDNLFLGGTETSANTLSWCLLHLIDKPDVQRRIRDEIKGVCDEGRLPRYSDKDNMPFTEAVILEIHRLHTVAPLGVPHYANSTTDLGNYTIPEGTIILANIWGVHHDPDIWEDPDVFRPNRFLDENGQVCQKEEWIPFSIGRRVCLGERLAKME